MLNIFQEYNQCKADLGYKLFLIKQREKIYLLWQTHTKLVYWGVKQELQPHSHYIFHTLTPKMHLLANKNWGLF